MQDLQLLFVVAIFLCGFGFGYFMGCASSLIMFTKILSKVATKSVAPLLKEFISSKKRDDKSEKTDNNMND